MPPPVIQVVTTFVWSQLTQLMLCTSGLLRFFFLFTAIPPVILHAHFPRTFAIVHRMYVCMYVATIIITIGYNLLLFFYLLILLSPLSGHH